MALLAEELAVELELALLTSETSISVPGMRLPLFVKCRPIEVADVGETVVPSTVTVTRTGCGPGSGGGLVSLHW